MKPLINPKKTLPEALSSILPISIYRKSMPPEQPTGRLLPFAEIQVNSTSSHKQWLRASWCWGPGLGTGSVEAASDEAWVRSVLRLRWQHSPARRGDARRWVTEGAAEISFTQVWLQVVTQDVSKLEDVHQSKRSHLRKCLMRKQPIYRGWLRLCFKLLYADMETRSNSWLTAFKGGWIFPALRCGYRLEFTVYVIPSYIGAHFYSSPRRPCLLSRPVGFDSTVLLSCLEKWGQKVRLHLGKTSFFFSSQVGACYWMAFTCACFFLIKLLLFLNKT